MKLLLRRCLICLAWHKPCANHCPYCGAMPVRIGKRNTHLREVREDKFIELVSACDSVPLALRNLYNS